MDPITIYGFKLSSYVRTARMTCIEKGIEHRFEELHPGRDDLAQHHPFRRVPSATHGDLKLFETSAICRYIDDAFDGPSLVPSTAAGRAVMEQWISTVNAYAYTACVRNYALEYVLPMLMGKPQDRTKIDASVPDMRHAFVELDRAYEGKEWVAGSFSLADIFIGPVVMSAMPFPEGKEILETSGKNLLRLITQLRARKSAEFLAPALPPR